MINAHAVLAAASLHAGKPVTPSDPPSLPAALERALDEFGLMRPFRFWPPAQQLERVRWVAASPTDALRRSRIAAVLDELALGAPAGYVLRDYSS
jgi:hypothetical protein